MDKTELLERYEEIGGSGGMLKKALNMISSDYGNIIKKWVEGDSDKYVSACYDFAVAKLTDAERLKFIRWYFNLE